MMVASRMICLLRSDPSPSDVPTSGKNFVEHKPRAFPQARTRKGEFSIQTWERRWPRSIGRRRNAHPALPLTAGQSHLRCGPSVEQLGGRNTDRVDRIGSLPLKGGGQEGVGAALTTLRANETTAAYGSRRAKLGSALGWRIGAAPTPSCPPPFRGRDPIQSSRSIPRRKSAHRRTAEAPYAIAVPLREGQQVAGTEPSCCRVRSQISPNRKNPTSVVGLASSSPSVNPFSCERRATGWESNS